jgi:hypothetical protein
MSYLNLDNYARYTVTPHGDVFALDGKTPKTKLLNGTVVSLLFNGKSRNISIARLAYHQHIGRVEPGDTVSIEENNSKAEEAPETFKFFLDKLVLVRKGEANPKKLRRLSLENRESISALYQTGKYEVSDLAAKYDVSMASIYNVLSGRLSGCKANELFRKTSPEGAKRGDRIRKVNAEIASYISSLRSEGKSFAEIGRLLDLNPRTVKKYSI